MGGLPARAPVSLGPTARVPVWQSTSAAALARERPGPLLSWSYPSNSGILAVRNWGDLGSPLQPGLPEAPPLVAGPAKVSGRRPSSLPCSSLPPTQLPAPPPSPPCPGHLAPAHPWASVCRGLSTRNALPCLLPASPWAGPSKRHSDTRPLPESRPRWLRSGFQSLGLLFACRGGCLPMSPGLSGSRVGPPQTPDLAPAWPTVGAQRAAGTWGTVSWRSQRRRRLCAGHRARVRAEDSSGGLARVWRLRPVSPSSARRGVTRCEDGSPC